MVVEVRKFVTFPYFSLLSPHIHGIYLTTTPLWIYYLWVWYLPLADSLFGYFLVILIGLAEGYNIHET